MRTVAASLAAGLILAAPLRAADLRYVDDAALYAVHFVDSKEGWAVGDEGTIWHSIDGGRSWERQPTGLRASLRSLHFLNPYVGWVVGREEQPHGGGSIGVLLFTRDGGLKWQRLLTNALPGLNQVRFADPKTGLVLGDGSEPFPSGVFRTSDGGRTWEAVPGPRATTWLTGAFLAADHGLLAGAWGRLANLRPEGFGIADVEALGGRNLRGLHVLDRRALAVGQGGLVLTSVSGGSRWGFADLKLPREVLANLDFHALHGVGEQAWVVGRPGSVLLTSSDQGVTWKLHKTGHDLPLNGIFFADGKNGWAVGEAGCILASSDGGLTWTVQRRGGQRAALLLVQAHAADLPVELLSALGADEGYLATAVQVAAPSASAAIPERALAPQRWAAAVRRAGGLTGELLWQFPVPEHLLQADKSALLGHWNALHDDQADQHLLRQLVLAVRMWRPEAVVADCPQPQPSRSPVSSLIALAVQQACTLAADPQAFPEQIDRLGLQPWRVRRLLALSDKREEAQVVLDGHKVCVRLAATPRDFAAEAAGLLAEVPPSLPRERCLRLLLEGAAGVRQLPHPLAGLDLQPGSGVRRVLPAAETVPDDVVKAARARRNLEVLIANLDDPAKALAQIGPTLAHLPDDQGAAAALALASQYARLGQWQLAREVFLLMVERYPAHPLAAGAYRWLIHHSSSSEARRRHELGQFLVVTQLGFTHAPLLENKRPKPLSPPGRGVGSEGKITTVAATEAVAEGKLAFLGNLQDSRHWYRSSLEFGKRLSSFGPVFAADPSVQFCLQASRRQLGEFEAARDWYSKFVAHAAPGPWREAAAAELWLTNRTLKAPRPVATSRLAEARPFLDGKLDDPCWQEIKPLTLVNAAADSAKDYATEAWFAHDRDFLYFALRCRHPAGQRVPPVTTRTRDPEMQAFDRVSILLDVDRDYTTCYQLQIDQRGCVGEDCWHDRKWNPRWFVAVHSTDDCWQIEAALPLAELTSDHLHSGTAWACNVVRILPGRGVQAWSLPADVQPRPEGLGLLLFQTPPPPPGR